MSVFIEAEDSAGKKVSLRIDAIIAVVDEGENGVLIKFESIGTEAGLRLKKPYNEFMTWLEAQLQE